MSFRWAGIILGALMVVAWLAHFIQGNYDYGLISLFFAFFLFYLFTDAPFDRGEL